MKTQKILLCCLLGLVAAGANAERSNIAVGVGVGTTGIDAGVTYPVMDNLNVRGVISGFNYSKDFENSDLKYDGKLKLFNVGVLADYYPMAGNEDANWFANNFKITAGLVYNGTKVNVDAKPNSYAEYTINNTTYTTNDVENLNGKIKWKNKVAPYIGVGLGNAAAKKGFSVSGDLGVMYLGKPKGSLHASCSATLSAIPGARDTLQSNVKAQEDKLNDYADKAKFWPVVRVMVNYSF